jgi:hypothetical protein
VRYTECCFNLIRAARTPEHNADSLIEHPTHREMDHVSVETTLCELIEASHGVRGALLWLWLRPRILNGSQCALQVLRAHFCESPAHFNCKGSTIETLLAVCESVCQCFGDHHDGRSYAQ